ncbi:MAG: transposase [Phenylobacterium zucineum]|nr:MAG: transposase [Phenylobacterium zucineum]
MVEPPETRRASAPPPAPRAELDFVVIDVETACPRVSSICQIGIVGFAGGREVLNYETLVDPQDSFSGFNTRLHGIGPQHVAGKPTFPRLYGALLEHLGGRVTVAHSNFDQGALSAACRIASLPMIQSRWLDSVQVARHAWPELPTHRLNALAEHLGLEHQHHDALSDARVAGWVVVRAMEQTGLGLSDLLAAPWRGSSRQGKRPRAAANGPLRGERIAIVGAAGDPGLAGEIAAAGGRLMSNVGRTTTLLVVAAPRPFSYAVRHSTPFMRAEALAADGAPIGILTAEELRDRIAAAKA